MLRQLATFLLLSPVTLMPVQAHQIESALSYLDGTLELSSSFSNGEPTKGAVVRLLNADGSAGTELGRTDASGKLKLDLSGVDDGVVDLHRYSALSFLSGSSSCSLFLPFTRC